MENLIKFDRDVDMRASTHLEPRGVRAAHVNASDAPAASLEPRPEPTAAVADIGRNGKYISSRAKSPLHTPRVAGPGRAFDSNEPWPPPLLRAPRYRTVRERAPRAATACCTRTHATLRTHHTTLPTLPTWQHQLTPHVPTAENVSQM